MAYGTINLPNNSGYHQVSLNTWILHGNLNQETLSYFLSTKPMMNTSDPVSSNLENRKLLITKPGPTLHISFEVILRNFSYHNISGQRK